MDEIVTSTGFFTSRYAVLDIYEKLNNLYDYVDDYTVTQAVDRVTHTILPHTREFLEVLGYSLSSRSSSGLESTGSSAIGVDTVVEVQVEEVLAPLELLFEFGELHTQFPVDPALRPVLLFGADTRYIGDTAELQKLSKSSASSITNTTLHCVVEGYEPSSGMRWCRSYFLHRGKCAHPIQIESLVNTKNDVKRGRVDDAEGHEDLDKEILQLTNNVHQNISAVVEQGIRRLEALYVKLYIALRYSVRSSFGKYNDLMEAAGDIQVSLIIHIL